MIGQTLSHYKITGHLGAGGMGEVYRAEDARLGREVALKVLPRDMARDVVRLERFSREARAVAALNHPNIVTIHSVEDAGGVHFITMELVDGQTLDHLIAEAGLSLRQLFELAVPLADALSCAHEKGIVHRDLKPANVMITADGRLKVLDFGLAKLHGADTDLAEAATVSRLLTQDGTVMGTYPYMSPEQVEGKHLDPRTDLFSFGTIVYELATGHRPFSGDSSPALMSSILRDQPRPLAELRADLPRHLGRILSRCLEKDPRDRYQSARSVYNELNSLRTETTSGSETAHSASSGQASRYERPWIAINSFKVRGTDAAMEDFSEGLAEDITAGLSRFNYLSVVARNPGFGINDESRVEADKTAARYLVEGSVRKGGSTIRVGVRLVDTRNGAHLWAETYTRNIETLDIFSVQDDITGRVVATVADGYGVLARSLISGIEGKPDEELEPSEWLLRNLDYMLHLTPADHARLRSGIEEAVKRYPRSADVWSVVAHVYLNEWSFGFDPKPDTLDRALAAAERAVDLDRTNQLAYQLLAQVHFFRQDLVRFRPAADRAIALNPLDTNTVAILGIVTAHTGEFERGAELTRRAMDMNPHHAGWYHFGLIWLHFSRGEYEQALERVSHINMPGMFYAYLVMAAICGHLGRESDARVAVNRLLELDPEFPTHARHNIECWHFASGLLEPLLDGLRKAGLEFADEIPVNTVAAVAASQSTNATSAAPTKSEGITGQQTDVANAELSFKDTSPDQDHDDLCEDRAEEVMADGAPPAGPGSLPSGTAGSDTVNPETQDQGTVSHRADAASVDSTTGEAMPRSLAVLPLANLSGDPEQEFFVAGMHDALINELARIGSLSVISRTSAMQFKGSTEPLPQIASKLSVEAIVEGSVLKAGNRVRINLQLVNARPERHLWADSFDGAVEDIFVLHSRVAGEVSAAVRARLTEEEKQRSRARRKVDPEAYDAYLRARHLSFVSAETSYRGIRLYEQAIERDPDFAPAYAGMARNLVFLAMLGIAPSREVLPRAAEAARTAIRLDPESGDARSIHGYISMVLDWDWPTARRELERAREMEPNNVSVLTDSMFLLAVAGSAEMAIELADRAAELDPMSPTTLLWKGWARFLNEDYQGALDGFRSSLEADPAFAHGALWMGLAYGMMGQQEKAAELASRAEQMNPDPDNGDFHALLGAAYCMGDQAPEARRILACLESCGLDESARAAQTGFIYGWLGEYDKAVKFYSRAFADRSSGVLFLANHPVCDMPRSDPRVMEMIKELGFPVTRPMLPGSAAGGATSPTDSPDT
ncbi:MAG: protein kinase [Gammaproteobacteria bacterium]